MAYDIEFHKKVKVFLQLITIIKYLRGEGGGVKGKTYRKIKQILLIISMTIDSKT